MVATITRPSSLAESIPSDAAFQARKDPAGSVYTDAMGRTIVTYLTMPSLPPKFLYVLPDGRLVAMQRHKATWPLKLADPDHGVMIANPAK